MSTRVYTGQVPVTPPASSWRDSAACVNHPPELWFPVRLENTGNARRDDPTIAAALAVCHSCPVETECRRWAISNGEDWGIWGGTLPADRRDATGRARRKPPPPPRTCIHCGGTFTPLTVPQRYCADECRRAAERQRRAVRELRRDADPCGSPAGIRLHYMRNQPLCGACVAARQLIAAKSLEGTPA